MYLSISPHKTQLFLVFYVAWDHGSSEVLIALNYGILTAVIDLNGV